ncbi:hypothetical protein [Spiroplasma endosymbiont of Eupeodes luniger]
MLVKLVNCFPVWKVTKRNRYLVDLRPLFLNLINRLLAIPFLLKYSYKI